jgi:glycine/D-amino acid oxidase-like deaminating enzyme
MFDRRNEGESCWTATAQLPVFQPLAQSLDVDVVVIGGGVTGITTAHLLKQAGVRVALIEQHRCGSGQTGRSTAHLTAVTDVPLTRLVERQGADQARAMWEAGFAAISRIRAEIRDARINCEFAWVRGCLHAPVDQPLSQARAALTQEASIANALGLEAAYVDQVQGLGRPGVWFDGQARLHPLRYLSVLLDRIDGDGSFVFEQTPIDDIDGESLKVRSGPFTVSARYIVVATHVPLAAALRDVPELRLATSAMTSYAISGTAPHGYLDEGLYWEHCESPYEYLRVDRDEQHDVVIFGGVDHAGETSAAAGDHIARLERRLASRIPGVRVMHRWSGAIVETADGRPYIGEVQPGIFIATGYGGNGMTYGTLAGMMAVDAARGARSQWSDLFDPRRSMGLTSPWKHELAGQEAS